MIHRSPAGRMLALFGIAILCAMAFLSAAPVSVAQTGNLVANGDFSGGSANWNLIGAVGVETCCAYGNNSFPGGGYPNAYAHPDGAGSNFAFWQNIPNPQAGNYRLSGWIRTSGGTQRTWIQADDGLPIVFCTTGTTNTNVWQQVSCSFTLPAGKPLHIALITSNASETRGGWVTWDNISLVRTTTPPPTPTRTPQMPPTATPPPGANSLKGANWLLFDTNYGSFDAPKVAWNLEIAETMHDAAWYNPVRDLYANYRIRTLVRIGYSVKPDGNELAILNRSTPPVACSEINGLLDRLNGEVNAMQAAITTAPEAFYAFILANEPNSTGEWNITGRGYARVYNCYLQRWNGGPYANHPLLASGPGSCTPGAPVAQACNPFFNELQVNLTQNQVDGFAVHAYGADATQFATGLQWQLTYINKNNKFGKPPIYITEYNTAAQPSAPLPNPTSGSWSTYFNSIYSWATNYNTSNSQQIKALLYFVDSPDPWKRRSTDYAPGLPWWQSSLLARPELRNAWIRAPYAP